MLGLIDGRGVTSHSGLLFWKGWTRRGDRSCIEWSCSCHGVCIGYFRPEAESQQTEIDHEMKNEFKKLSIAESNFEAEHGLICKADGGTEVHDDSGWRVVIGCRAETRQHVKINT